VPPTARYVAGSIALGYLGVPVLVAVPSAFLTASIESTAWQLAAAAMVGMVVAFGLGALRGRSPRRPGRWVPALLPVVASPAALLLLWVVAYGVTGTLAATVDVFFVPALAYLPLVLSILFGGAPLVIPVTLVAVLAGTVAGFLVGARGEPRPTGRQSLAVILVACLALVATASAQVGQQVATAILLTGEASMSDEVNLWQYQPFVTGNRLAVPDRPPSLRISADYPRLDGATALYPLYAAIGQATYQLPDAAAHENDRIDFADRYLACSTTSVAYDRLIGGEVDAIFVAQPSKGQLAKAGEAGVELSLTPIGREAFVFFVNRDNPVENLTLDQVRDIYSRRITNWKQVGGRDEPIVAFQRPEDSGSQTAMLAMVMKDRAMADPLKEEVATGMGGIVSEVAGYRNLTGAIGYSFRWYATVMNANPGIRLVAIDGVPPTLDSIRDGSYPLTGGINIVTTRPPGPPLRALIDWTLSAEGQALLEKTGYVGR